jgi:hypothetical protein
LKTEDATILEAMQLIRRYDPELWEQMDRQDWTVRTEPQNFDEMMQFLMPALGSTEPNDKITLVNLRAHELELAVSQESGMLNGVTFLEFVAVTLIHEFIHLLPVIGETEVGPIRRAREFALRLSSDSGIELAAYQDVLLQTKVNADGNWAVFDK